MIEVTHSIIFESVKKSPLHHLLNNLDIEVSSIKFTSEAIGREIHRKIDLTSVT